MQNTPNPAVPQPPSDTQPVAEQPIDTDATEETEVNDGSAAPDSGSQQAAVASAIVAARADALAIVEMCQLAGHSERATAFLSQGTPVDQVRRALLEARAQSTEITSLIHPDATSAQARNENSPLHIPPNNPLLQAVKKLTTKD